MRNSELLLDDRITAEEFLNRIVYKQNNLDFGLIDVDTVNIIIDEEEEDSGFSDDESSSQMQTQLSCPKNVCIACEDNYAVMCVLPCFDVCFCEQCWNILMEDFGNSNCPKCDGPVEKIKELNFMQNIHLISNIKTFTKKQASTNEI